MLLIFLQGFSGRQFIVCLDCRTHSKFIIKPGMLGYNLIVITFCNRAHCPLSTAVTSIAKVTRLTSWWGSVSSATAAPPTPHPPSTTPIKRTRLPFSPLNTDFIVLFWRPNHFCDRVNVLNNKKLSPACLLPILNMSHSQLNFIFIHIVASISIYQSWQAFNGSTPEGAEWILEKVPHPLRSPWERRGWGRLTFVQVNFNWRCGVVIGPLVRHSLARFTLWSIKALLPGNQGFQKVASCWLPSSSVRPCGSLNEIGSDVTV